MPLLQSNWLTRETSAQSVPELIHLIDPHEENYTYIYIYLNIYKTNIKLKEKNLTKTTTLPATNFQQLYKWALGKAKRKSTEHTIRLHYSEPK